MLLTLENFKKQMVVTLPNGTHGVEKYSVKHVK